VKQPEVVECTSEQVQELIAGVRANQLTEPQQELVVQALQFHVWLRFALAEAKIGIKKLCRLFGLRTEKRSHLPKEKEQNDPAPGKPRLPPEITASSPTDPPSKKRKRGLSKFTGAKTVEVQHAQLQAGDPCPTECGGKLYAWQPGVIIRLIGSPLAQATRYLQEKLRCALCGEIFTAPLPEGVPPEAVYDETLKATLSLQKYFLGSPFYRMERFQEMVGVPLSDSKQWDLVEEVGDAAFPVYQKLIQDAAQMDLAHNDDTHMRVLELMKENQDDPELERKGMYTTGILAVKGERKIPLFFTGRQTAGENLDEVLQHRSAELKTILQMADGLGASRTKEAETLESNCLTHGRRKFVEIFEAFPEACQKVIDDLAEVYQVDTFTKTRRMSDAERLKLHQTCSKPILDELQLWMNQQLDQRIVEPNSSLGKALKYCLKRWKEMTRFLQILGAPLDNNACEQTLKVPILNRKNAYFYKTLHGALIGDILMSVIYTCYLAGENAFDYLVRLQYHRSEVLKSPEDWLPWTYRQSLGHLEGKQA